HPVDRLDPARELRAQPIPALELDLVLPCPLVAGDDEDDLAFAAALELGADGAEAAFVAGEDGEAAADLFGGLVEGFGADQAEADAVGALVGLDREDHRAAGDEDVAILVELLGE